MKGNTGKLSPCGSVPPLTFRPVGPGFVEHQGRLDLHRDDGRHHLYPVDVHEGDEHLTGDGIRNRGWLGEYAHRGAQPCCP